MKKTSFKKMILWIVLLFILYTIIDIIVNWDHAVEAFHKGYNDMHQIQQQKIKK